MMDRACPAAAPAAWSVPPSAEMSTPRPGPSHTAIPMPSASATARVLTVVNDRPNADPARALASSPREGERERDEDQGRDDHAEQPHKQIGDRLQHDGRLPEEHPDEHATHRSHDDLKVKRHWRGAQPKLGADGNRTGVASRPRAG